MPQEIPHRAAPVPVTKGHAAATSPLPTGKQAPKMESRGGGTALHRTRSQGPSSSKWSLDHGIVGLPDPPESHSPLPHPLASASALALASAHVARLPRLQPPPRHGGGKGLRTPCSLQGSQRPVFPVLRHFQPLTHLLANYLYPLNKCSAQCSKQTSLFCWQPKTCGRGLGTTNVQADKPN